MHNSVAVYSNVLLCYYNSSFTFSHAPPPPPAGMDQLCQSVPALDQFPTVRIPSIDR